jgi:hypothetical protein
MFFKTRKSYRDIHPLDNRIAESQRIVCKYPKHIPVIVENDGNLPQLKKNKYLVPDDVPASQIILSIRKNMDVDSSTAIFIFYDDIMICPSMLMRPLYEQYLIKKSTDLKKSNGNEDEMKDNFFYVYVAFENTFGKMY